MDTFALLRLMERMQLRGPTPEQEEGDANTASVPSKSKAAREEAILEAKIVKTITSGQWEKLQPNTGRSVAVGDHHVCVAYHDEPATGYRTWEWHGHLILFDDEKGYVPEYIYGNFFQPMEKKIDLQDGGIAIGIGLGGIIEANDSRKMGPILHRSVKNFDSTKH